MGATPRRSTRIWSSGSALRTATTRSSALCARCGGGSLSASTCSRVSPGRKPSCQFTLLQRQADLLSNVLPTILHIPQQAGSETLRRCIDAMRRELSESQPGGLIIAQQLAPMILVHALQIHVSTAQRQETGWLFALFYRQLKTASLQCTSRRESDGACRGSPGRLECHALRSHFASRKSWAFLPWST